MHIWGAIDSSEHPTAVASAGVAQGSFVMNVTALGHVTGSVGGENFSGDLAAFNPGEQDSITLTGDRGNTITINYLQDALAASLSDEAIDFNSGPATFTFVAGPGTATVSGLTAAPAAGAGTYAFTSSGPGSLTLTGPGGAVTQTVNNMAANGTQTLTFGNLSFTLTADANGMSAASIVSNLLQPANDSIVVTSTPGATNTITTGGAGVHATFQIGANAPDTLQVDFGNVQMGAGNGGTDANMNGLDTAIAAFTTAVTSGGVTAASDALITATDAAISTVSAMNSNFGAVENRLNDTVATLSVTSQNLDASQSRIKDLNVAAEMVNFTKTQILQQAGTAILAQANSAPQNILTLLR